MSYHVLRCAAVAGLTMLIGSVAAHAENSSAPIQAPASDESMTVLGVRPLETTRFVNPSVSTIDALDAREGWVHLRLSLSANGDVTSADVIEAFPKNHYEDAVLRVARGWKFPPGVSDGLPDTDFEVGIAIYSELYESQRNVSTFRGGHQRGISDYNFNSLNKTMNGLLGEPENLDAVGHRVEKLGKRYADGDMTITDIARYFAIMTRYERLAGHYNSALAYARGTLLLGRFLDNRKALYAIHLEILSTLMAAGRNDDAVDYYDSWRKVMKVPLSREGAAHMEELRAQGAGKGHSYTIIDFDAFRRMERHHVTGATRSVVVDPTTGQTAEIALPAMSTSLERISLDFPEPQIAKR